MNNKSMEILPPWLIEKLEELRKEQTRSNEVRIEIPIDNIEIHKKSIEDTDKDSTIIISFI